MRILITHPRLSVMGGGERVAIHSIKEALREGHEVSVACEEFDIPTFENFFDVQGLFNNVRLLVYPPFHPLAHSAVLYQRLIYHQLRLRRILSREKGFDLILNTAEVANQPASRSHSIQYCYFPEYFSHLESNGARPLWEIYYWPARVFYRNRVEQVDRLLAVSNFSREFVREKWGRDSTTLYPPCPTNLYNGMNLPREDLVVTVGRIAPEKRMTIFADIARMLPGMRFAIIGSVSEERKAYYDKLRHGAPENLSFVVAPLRMAKETLARAKVYLHCARNEHFGITIVEAMAAGCVPIVHNSGGPREIVSEDTGYTWNSKQEAVAHINRVISDNPLRLRLSKAAASRSSQFGTERFESGMANVFRSFS